jgi:hypothetical protein
LFAQFHFDCCVHNPLPSPFPDIFLRGVSLEKSQLWHTTVNDLARKNGDNHDTNKKIGRQHQTINKKNLTLYGL